MQKLQIPKEWNLGNDHGFDKLKLFVLVTHKPESLEEWGKTLWLNRARQKINKDHFKKKKRLKILNS